MLPFSQWRRLETQLCPSAIEEIWTKIRPRESRLAVEMQRFVVVTISFDASNRTLNSIETEYLHLGLDWPWPCCPFAWQVSETRQKYSKIFFATALTASSPRDNGEVRKRAGAQTVKDGLATRMHRSPSSVRYHLILSTALGRVVQLSDIHLTPSKE